MLVAVAAFALAAGWWLLRPQPKVATQQVEVSATASQEPAAEETPPAEATEAPTEQPVATPAPELTETPQRRCDTFRSAHSAHRSKDRASRFDR